MTNVASSGSSNNTSGVCSRPHGVPKKCWCGMPAISKTSRLDPNPGHRYFRCTIACENKLMNDNHCFKWVDEALLEEFRIMKGEIQSLQSDVEEQMQKLEMMQKVVEELCEKTVAIVNYQTKKTIVVVTLLCLVVSCLFKFF